MRIRKRPHIIPLPPSTSSSSSSLSQYSDPSSSSSSLQHQALINGGRKGETTKYIIDHCDPQVQLHPEPINIQVIKDEKGVRLDPSPSSSSSPPKALDAQLHNNNGRSTKSNDNGKKRRSPAVLMEGSRCSRVNGRGWRCSQQTHIGYSLCEHHLGKGRIKSVTSVRGGAKAVINNNTSRTLKKKKNDLNLYDDEGEDSRLAAQVLASLQQDG